MVTTRQVTYSEISPSEFFYRNRDLAGFSNPSRALYTSVRELVENSLDACEQDQILPEIVVRIENAPEGTKAGDQVAYVITVQDNGPGIESKHLPNAFGRVFYGSKYKLKQSRGMFGMGGTMAILYAQITTNKPVTISSSFDGKNFHTLDMLIDIQENKPVILRHETKPANGLTGTTVSLTLMGDYFRAGPKILDYFKQTALVNPYANITLVDPDGKETKYERGTTVSPQAPTETLPHPHGIDVEALRRLIKETQDLNLVKFMTHNFHRVGERTAEKFLRFAGFDPTRKPKSLTNEEAVKFVNALHSFEEFLAPDASCLSPLGEEIMQAGIMKELSPEFIAMSVRPPSAYSGFPFIVEVGLAYGGPVIQPGVRLLRFANRIPLLYDEANDVAFKVINEEIDWKRYRIPQDAPVSIITHVCSTKVPYKTVGKEYLADRPELERELKNATREVIRKLSVFVSRKGSMEFAKKKMNIYGKYLPLIAKFCTELSSKKKVPDYKKLLGSIEVIEPGSDTEEKWGEFQKSTNEIMEADAKQKKNSKREPQQQQQQQQSNAERGKDDSADAGASSERAVNGKKNDKQQNLEEFGS